MLLKLNNKNVTLRLIYTLEEALNHDVELIKKTQALTLDDSKPMMGLRGAYGLYGSVEWWNNIKNGVMPLLYMNGRISDIYASGQDTGTVPDTCDLITESGEVHSLSFYANDSVNEKMYKIGKMVNLVYALDPLKKEMFDEKGDLVYGMELLELAVEE